MNTILFDLDGTLLPMDQDLFIREYIKALAGRFAGHGYNPERFSRALMAGTMAVIQNDGSRTNEERFWEVFSAGIDPKIRERMPEFLDFYATEFPPLRRVVRESGRSRRAVDLLKAKGYDLVLATNPVFPEVATFQRVEWAGVRPEEFSLITTYENSSFCKPNPVYFEELLGKLGKRPGDCLMVGNDVDDDILSSAALGMENYLITDFLINRKGRALSDFRTGSFDDFLRFVEELPALA